MSEGGDRSLMGKVTLTVAKCRELCNDFRLVQHRKLGRKACMHLLPDAEMCRKDNHFVCELVLWKQRQAAKEEREGKNAITPGASNLLEKCPRKYHLKREKFLKPPAGEPSWKRVSSAFNMARAKIDLGAELILDSVRSDISPLNRAKVRASLRFYADGHHAYAVGSVDCDQSIQFEFEGQWYRGFASAVTKDGGTVYSWRYGKEPMTHLKAAHEAAILLHGYPGATRYVSLLMKKPQNRPRKGGETMAAFEDRIVEHLNKKPGETMKRLQITRDHMDVEGVLRQMRTKMELLPALHAAGMPAFYSDCTGCDYAIMCEQRPGDSTNEIVRRMTLREENP